MISLVSAQCREARVINLQNITQHYWEPDSSCVRYRVCNEEDVTSNHVPSSLIRFSLN